MKLLGRKTLSSFFPHISWFSKLKPRSCTSSNSVHPPQIIARKDDANGRSGGGSFSFDYYTDDELDTNVKNRGCRRRTEVKREGMGSRGKEEQRRSVDISRGMRRRRWKRRRRSIGKCGKEMEMVAVVKISVNPEGDFRESMVEMVKGKTTEELEKLLECYLVLNSGDCHNLIIKVFREVWWEMKWKK